MTNTLVAADSCFWLGLADKGDQHHEAANALADYLKDYTVLFPWPCLYETLYTKLVNDRRKVIFIEELLKQPNVISFDDSQYRETALTELFKENFHGRIGKSLVDHVIREMVKDSELRIRYLITFNHRDFCDLENDWFQIVELC